MNDNKIIKEHNTKDFFDLTLNEILINISETLIIIINEIILLIDDIKKNYNNKKYWWNTITFYFNQFIKIFLKEERLIYVGILFIFLSLFIHFITIAN